MIQHENLTIAPTEKSFEFAVQAFVALSDYSSGPSKISIVRFSNDENEYRTRLEALDNPAILLVDRPYKPTAKYIAKQTLEIARTVLELRQAGNEAYHSVIMPRDAESYHFRDAAEKSLFGELGAMSMQDVYGLSSRELFRIDEPLVHMRAHALAA
jgi:hypothetical protein